MGYGNLLNEAGRFAEARAALAESSLITERVYGPDSLTFVYALYNLARADLGLGHCDDALVSSRRQLEISNRILGVDRPDQILDYVTRGDIYATCLKRAPEARTAYEHAISIAEANPTANLLPTAVGSYGLGLVKLGRAAEAIPHLERTLSLLATTQDVVQTAMYTTALGDALLAVGRATDALNRFRASALMYEQLDAKIELAWALHGMGSALLTLRRPTDAVAPLERAVKLVESGRPDHVLPQRMALARALWDGSVDRERAVALVREVAAGYAKAGPTYANDRRDAEAWLASHEARRFMR
jgi:tetratricopeptide (TPR) repeat protein